MKIVFVYWGYENAGSMLDLRGYARAAEAMGHEVKVYGPPNNKLGLDYSLHLDDADAVVFVFEWTVSLQFGDRVDWVRMLESVPRNRRIVIDCDGAYNDPVEFRGDYNHRKEELSRHWTDVCDSISDKIFQPTLRPLRKNVRPFLFHIYDPTWEAPLEFSDKEFSMIYVGHTKHRWYGMEQVLKAIEKVRGQIGRVGLVGEGWAFAPDYMQWEDIKANYYVDREYLKKIRVEALPAVPFAEVAATIDKGVFNPVIYRPLFDYLGMVTCRTFETPAAGTIPLFLLDRNYVREIYGEAALQLMLDGDNMHETVLDIVRHPQKYAEIVLGIRKEFAVRHTPEARLRELLGYIGE